MRWPASLLVFKEPNIMPHGAATDIVTGAPPTIEVDRCTNAVQVTEFYRGTTMAAVRQGMTL